LQRAEDGSNKPFYGEAIKRMCMHRKSSLAVSYKHLCRTPECAIIAIYLADCPMEMLKILSRVAKDVTLRLVPAYGELNEEIHVRIKDLPVKELIRDIRQNHLNALIRVCPHCDRRPVI
jgi:DNA replication licensing factor MCM2